MAGNKHKPTPNPGSVAADLKIHNNQLTILRKAKERVGGFPIYQRVVMSVDKLLDKYDLDSDNLNVILDVHSRNVGHWMDTAGELTVMEEQLYFLESKGGPRYAKPLAQRNAQFRQRLLLSIKAIKRGAKLQLKEMETTLEAPPRKVSAWRVGSVGLSTEEYVAKHLESLNAELSKAYDVKQSSVKKLAELFIKTKKLIAGLLHVLKDEKPTVTASTVGDWIEIYAQLKLALHHRAMLYRPGSAGYAYAKKHKDKIQADSTSYLQSMANVKDHVKAAFKSEEAAVRSNEAASKPSPAKPSGSLMPGKPVQSVADQLRKLGSDIRQWNRKHGGSIPVPTTLDEAETYGFEKRSPYQRNRGLVFYALGISGLQKPTTMKTTMKTTRGK